MVPRKIRWLIYCITFPTWCIYATTLEPILARISEIDERPAPPPASANALAATSQKFCLTIFLLRAPRKNPKKEREISARFRPPSIRAVRRGYQRSDGSTFLPPTPSCRAALVSRAGGYLQKRNNLVLF